MEALQDAACLGDVVRVPLHDVLAVRGAQLDIAEAELARGDLAGVSQVRGDFVGEHRQGEGGRRAERREPIQGQHGAQGRGPEPGDEFTA